MTAVIKPDRVRIDETRTFELTDGGKPVEVTSWVCDPPTAGTFAGADLTPSSGAPATFAVVATRADGTAERATVTVTLGWREGWPFLGEGWEKATPAGVTQWVARAMYDLLTYMPEPLVEAIGPVEIAYVGSLPGAGGHYNWAHLPHHRIDVPQQSLDNTLDRGNALTTPDASGRITAHADGYRVFCDLMLHEMAHTAMMNRCGGPLVSWGQYANEISDLILGLALQLNPGMFFLTPFLPLELIMGAGGLNERDYVSTWCEATGWVMKNLEGGRIPLIGGLLSMFTTQSPNWATAASQLAWYTGLRNQKQTHLWPRLKQMIYEEKRSTIANPTPEQQVENAAITKRNGEIDTEIKAAVAAADMPTAYAHASPLEDFADSIVLRLRKEANGSGLLYAREPLSKNRSDFLEQDGLVPSSWTPPPGGYQVTAYAQREIDHTPVAPRPPDEAAAAASAKAEKVFAALAAFEDGDGRVLAKTREAAGAAFEGREVDSSLAVAKIAEAHGGGLTRFDRTPAEPGDLLLGQERDVFVALATDEAGRVERVGGYVGVQRGMTPADTARSRDSVKLQWRPGKEPRVFAAAADASPAYADVNATLHALVDRWGDERDPATDRDLRSTTGFFQHLLAVGGLHDRAELDDHAAVLSHLRTYGAGLEAFGPGDRCQVGDVLLPYHGNSIAVVTRVDEHGAPVDVIEGGIQEPGALGESDVAVQLHHGVDRNDYRQRWSPSKQARTWSPEPVKSDLFDDLDRSLNHVLANVGRERFRRHDADHNVYHWSSLQLLAALMLEKSVAPAASKVLAEIGWTAAGKAARNFLYTHGEVGARGPCRPGDFIGWRDRAGGDRSGLVIAANEAGEPVKTAIVGDRVALDEAPVATASIYERCRPSSQPRALHEGDAAARFYGSPSALWQLIGRRGLQATEHHPIGGESVPLHFDEATDVATLAALGAPGWLKVRIRACGDVAAVRRIVDGLGQGATAYAGGPVPLGAWLFFEDAQLGFLVVNGDDGKPAAMFGMGADAYDFVPVELARLTHVWLPDTAPRRRTEHRNPEAYTDLDAELGRLRAWQDLKGAHIANNLPYWNRAWSPEAYVTDAVARVLADLPTGDAALAYVNRFGDGALAGDQAQPGDVLILDFGPAVALDGGDMIWWRNGHDYPVRIEPRAGVTHTWRPSARRR